MKNITTQSGRKPDRASTIGGASAATTLNAAFCERLAQYAAQAKSNLAMRGLRHVRSAGPYVRDEMNER